MTYDIILVHVQKTTSKIHRILKFNTIRMLAIREIGLTALENWISLDITLVI